MTNQGIEMRYSRNVGNSVQHCERSTERKPWSGKKAKVEGRKGNERERLEE